MELSSPISPYHRSTNNPHANANYEGTTFQRSRASLCPSSPKSPTLELSTRYNPPRHSYLVSVSPQHAQKFRHVGRNTAEHDRPSGRFAPQLSLISNCIIQSPTCWIPLNPVYTLCTTFFFLNMTIWVELSYLVRYPSIPAAYSLPWKRWAGGDEGLPQSSKECAQGYPSLVE